jgi:hypothetical protein
MHGLNTAAAHTLGFLDWEDIFARCMLTIAHLLANMPLFTHPAAYALGFLDCEDISARCMLTIFQFFATKTDASKLRMLSGSPAERLLKPITDYVEAKGGRLHIRWGCRC